LTELIGVRIWAISFEDRRAQAPRKLPCGVVVEDPTEEQRAGAPSSHPVRFEVPDNPGVFVPFSGLFLLPTGNLAAVYGAIQEPLG
jgi:hypothetical protein